MNTDFELICDNTEREKKMMILLRGIYVMRMNTVKKD